jgi:hypothetical protein
MTDQIDQTSLTDQRLTAELRRRSSVVHGVPDWVSSTLAPAVVDHIGAQPQQVVHSRLSAWVSFAAVATILMLLVVALPGLPALPNPGQPSASPSPRSIPCGQYTLLDYTGLVAHCDQVSSATDGVTNPAGDQTQLIAGWMGASCSQDVELSLQADGSGFVLSMQETGLPGCFGGITHRAVHLALVTPVSASSIGLVRNGHVVSESPIVTPALPTTAATPT